MRVRLVALAVALLAASPAVASAGTVRVANNTILATGDPGEDRLTVGPLDAAHRTDYRISNLVRPTPGAGCKVVPNTDMTVQCLTGRTDTRATIDLGTGEDSGIIYVPGVLRGGPDRDTLTSSIAGPQVIDGGDGDDSLDDDIVDDKCDGKPAVTKGPDEFIGGPGDDTVGYDGRTPGLRITLDDVANDGVPGERDNVHSDVENVWIFSSCAPNTVIATDGPNQIQGLGGTIDARGGDDNVFVEGFADRVTGGEGNDRVSTHAGNDVLDGGPGSDDLTGGAGDDTLTGGPDYDTFVGDEDFDDGKAVGNDTIDADDGIKEPVSCGPGADVVKADAVDDVAADCETVTRSTAGTPPPAAAPPAVATVVKARLVRRHRRLRLLLLCPRACQGTVAVRARKALAKPKAVKLNDGETRIVAFDVGRRARRQLRRRLTTLVVTASLSTSAGSAVVEQWIVVAR